MSSDYPPHFPPFMRDFHDQKDLFKVFMYYINQKIEASGMPDLSGVGDVSFVQMQILSAYFLDFMYMHGWQIYRTRKNGLGEGQDYLDIQETILEFKKMQISQIMGNGEGLPSIHDA